MYASPAARAEQIDHDAQRPDQWLVEALSRSSSHLRRDIAALDPAARVYPVRTSQGRTVPAEAIMWMRVRESALHLIDLDVGPTATDLPMPLATALLDDITAALGTRAEVPTVRLVATDCDRQWDLGAVVVATRDAADTVAAQAPVVGRKVAAPVADLLLWTSGRPPGVGRDRTGWPALPAWL